MGLGENKQYPFHEKLLGEEDCPGDELKNGGTERSTLPRSRSGGGSKQKQISKLFFYNKIYLPSRPGCGINI
jgi:hypothetical protein